MDFYIQVKDGKPIGNPMDELSVKLFDHFERGGIEGVFPEDFEPFLPTTFPEQQNVLEVMTESESYEKIDGYWQKTYTFRPMTKKEKTEHKNKTMKVWTEKGPGYPSWVYNEKTGLIDPPVAPPEGVIIKDWDEDNQQWITEELPPLPEVEPGAEEQS